MSIILAVLLGVVYFDLDYTQASVQDRAGALFLAVTAAMFTSMIAPFTLCK